MKVQIKVHMSLNGRDAMRSWALKNGHYVAAYGMIPYDIQAAFKAAHEQALKDASEQFLTDGEFVPEVRVRRQ